MLGRDAGVTLVVVLLALKTLELRARRDAFVVFFLGFFLMLTNFFYSQSLLTAAAMLLALLGLLTALVNAHMPVGKPPLWQAARMAGGMALLGAPIMVLLFVLFPRVAPLWGLPSDAMAGRSGLSASMTVGNIASLALDGSVAMRVRFEGAAPAQSALYFRGPVLSHFDGRSWQARPSSLPNRLRLPADLQVAGEPVRYQVTLEPNKLPWLLVLDATPQAPALAGKAARMTRELQWILDQPVTDLLRYDAVSYPSFQHGPLTRACRAWKSTWHCPAAINPRTLELAAELQRDPRYAARRQRPMGGRGHGAPAQRRLPLHAGARVCMASTAPTNSGLTARLGFCEHIASSFVILMRALNVPARIVTGYQGGEKNPVDDFWTVRQSDAHAWTEVWLDGQGWQRVDPTSAVAPARTGTLERLTPAARRHCQCHSGQREPGAGAQSARRLGRRQQPLEPVGAELHPDQATRPAQKHRLQGAQLAGPDLPAVRHRGGRQPGAAPPGAPGSATSRTPGCACCTWRCANSKPPAWRSPPTARRARSRGNCWTMRRGRRASPILRGKPGTTG